MKSTDKDLFACERQAHLYYENAAQVEKDRIADRNARTRLDEQLRKERVNSEFWNRVRQVLTVIAIALIAYTLFHFAGVSHVS